MTQSSKGQDVKAAEKQRLAEALRANLRRRKTSKDKAAAQRGETNEASAPEAADGNER